MYIIIISTLQRTFVLATMDEANCTAQASTPPMGRYPEGKKQNCELKLSETGKHGAHIGNYYGPLASSRFMCFYLSHLTFVDGNFKLFENFRAQRLQQYQEELKETMESTPEDETYISFLEQIIKSV